MNGQWENFDEPIVCALPAALLVGVIYIDGESASCEGETDDNLHATLCRMVGLKPLDHSDKYLRQNPLQPSATCLELAANTHRLASDLADEYQDLVRRHR